MFDNFSLFKGQMSGEYAMWWPCSEEPRFAGSATQAQISRAYRAMSGFESYHFTLLVGQILPNQESKGRFALPPQTARFPLLVGDGAMLIVSAGAEKGLRLHFPCDMIYAKRLDWWTRWADQCEQVAAILQKNDTVPDAQTPRTWKEKLRLRRSGLPPEAPLAWWKQMIEVTRATESVEPLLKVGALTH